MFVPSLVWLSVLTTCRSFRQATFTSVGSIPGSWDKAETRRKPAVLSGLDTEDIKREEVSGSWVLFLNRVLYTATKH